MILFLVPLTLLFPCRALLPIELMVVATKCAGIFFLPTDRPSGVGALGFLVLELT